MANIENNILINENSNLFQQNKKFDNQEFQNMKNLSKIPFIVFSVTSDNQRNSINDLVNFENTSGWISSRFCDYPQEIIIQFLSPIFLKQINLTIHENKIPTKIEFFSYFPNSYMNKYALNMNKFNPLGYICLDNNEKNSFNAREYRKIYIKSKCSYLKIILYKNHINFLNIFNQVGLISFECFGYFIENNIEIINSVKSQNEMIKDNDYDDLIKENLRILNEKLFEATNNKDLTKINSIKYNIEKIKLIGTKLIELNCKKSEYLLKEDYDAAKLLKLEINRYKGVIKMIIKNIPNVNIVNHSNEELYEENNNILSNSIDSHSIQEKKLNNEIIENEQQKSIKNDIQKLDNSHSFSQTM